MKPTVYIETTIPSYLAGRHTRDLIVSARQELTREWWDTRRHEFVLYVSQIVLDEAAEGDTDAAQRRLALLDRVPVLAINRAVIDLARQLIHVKALPEKAARDAAHVAVAAVHGVRFLLTWNCTHLANAEMVEDIERACAISGFRCPVICTPDELMGGIGDD